MSGGPEDGRRLSLAPGDWIGRAGRPARHALYAGTAILDRSLHREHAEWLGDGRLRSTEPCTVRSGGLAVTYAAGDAIPLHQGDLVDLSPVTRVRAV